jgi:hypothetical protein
MLRYIIATLILVLSAPALANTKFPPYVQKHIENPAPVGAGRMIYLFWSLYDATLIAPGGKFNYNQPFALTLSYLRPFEGRSIADTSAEEIRRQGKASEIKIAAWHDQMRRIFPSVEKQSTITGVYLPGEGAQFYHDGQYAGTITDADFARLFFDIWLGPDTRAPDLRRMLLGEG